MPLRRRERRRESALSIPARLPIRVVLRQPGIRKVPARRSPPGRPHQRNAGLLGAEQGVYPNGPEHRRRLHALDRDTRPLRLCPDLGILDAIPERAPPSQDPVDDSRYPH